ncbi:phage baseplate protein [Gallibacter intestinalis]|uniref:Baseplate structural protein Gp10 C-terminal domain-containing protein n=1 Tax=Gallibacter intestinalis TaxID=2779356 RepID=A0ABR9QXV4_9FIRM|nr:hypothetical protein [Gallibacter intestinalis]MBE5035707.1 hypothetical protein [Gallibacter intestinalis]
MAERNLGRVQGSSIWTSAAPLTDAGTQFAGTVSVKKTNGQSMRPIVGDKIVDSGTGNVYTIISSDTGTDKGDSTDYAITTENKTALFTLKGTPGADGAQGEPGTPGKDFDPNTSTVTFTEAGTDDSINSGETLPVLFGKTKRLFTRTANVEEEITISEETITAFKALGWTPPSGGAVIESLLNLIFDRAHPVGSYYWSSDSTNPSKLFGGTWEQVTDKFILAAGDTYKAGTTGGEATHVLTADEMPRHDGHLQKNSGSMSGGNTNMYLPTTSLNNYISGRGWNNDGGGEMYPVGVSRGNNEPHNNMPPYEVAYCWKRTA